MDPGPGFDIDVRVDGVATIVAAAGEADMESSPALRYALAGAAETGSGDVVVDLGGVTFLDSTALATLLNARRRLRRDGRRLAVASAQPAVAEVFRLARLDGDFGLYPSVAEALERR